MQARGSPPASIKKELNHILMRKLSILTLCMGAVISTIVSGSAAYRKLPVVDAPPLLRVIYTGCLLGNIEPCG
jgi:hypothetical protein